MFVKLNRASARLPLCESALGAEKREDESNELTRTVLETPKSNLSTLTDYSNTANYFPFCLNRFYYNGFSKSNQAVFKFLQILCYDLFRFLELY